VSKYPNTKQRDDNYELGTMGTKDIMLRIGCSGLISVEGSISLVDRDHKNFFNLATPWGRDLHSTWNNLGATIWEFMCGLVGDVF
jgi:hypothetical protein